MNSIIAVNRFGIGARPGEIEEASLEPKQWLIEQLRPLPISGQLPSSNQVLLANAEFKKQVKTMRALGGQESKSGNLFNYNVYRDFVQDSLELAIKTDQGVTWRLFEFFSNHFSVTGAGTKMKPLAPTLEREAIAPNLFGSFSDMLLAVTRHPAMLIYLNNEQSYGPNSFKGKRGRGLNENLAREILELHTLGSNGGYGQVDVLELAKGITGWSVADPQKDAKAGFLFREKGHEPGARKLLGITFANLGVKQGEAMLNMLAHHPKTARHVCRKLAGHFIADKPSKSLVDKLVRTWLKTNGNIREVLIALIEADEAWNEKRTKFKTPREFLISSLRVLGKKGIMNENQMFKGLIGFGQQPFNAGSPAGFSDYEEDWNGGSALVSRINWTDLVARKSKLSAKDVMRHSFANNVSQHTLKMVTNAESRNRALSLLLMSPEFQRR